MSPHERPFTFGVELVQPFDGMSWARSAQHLEELGYSTAFVPDHVHAEMGPIAAMATALAATTSLRVAPLVMAVDFRNPVFLAKEIATLDVMFPGRIDLGVGAGYNPLDYSRSGIPMVAAGRRVSRLIEYVEVLRLLFAGDVASYHGAEYHLEEVTGLPRPATPGGPAIMVAGGGPRLLRFAGSAADIVGVNPSTAAGRGSPETVRDALPASIDGKLVLLRTAAGDRWEDLVINSWTAVAEITDTPNRVVEAMASLAEVTADEVLASPIVLVGTRAELTDRLRERRERWGYSSICVAQPLTESFAPLVADLSGT